MGNPRTASGMNCRGRGPRDGWGFSESHASRAAILGTVTRIEVEGAVLRSPRMLAGLDPD